MITSTRICTAVLLCLGIQISGERPLPVVIMHGINSSVFYLRECARLIQQHVGNDVYIKEVEIGTGRLSSFWNLQDQCAEFDWKIRTDPFLIHGFNIVAHSQGGLIARNYIQEHNSDPYYPHVYTFITIGTPHQGVYGTPGTIDDKFKWLNDLEPYAYYILYSAFFQKFFSFPQYWHDTCHHQEYYEHCTFLPILNNHVPHAKAELYKHNLCSLNNFVLVRATREEIVEPADSSHFEFYQENCLNLVEPLQATEWYQNDALGLRTLYETGRLHFKIAETDHSGLTSDPNNIAQNVAPYLLPAAPAA